MGVLGGVDRCGCLGGEWARESGGEEVLEGWTDELVYLVSVGVECVCVKGSLVLVLVLNWTQCVPQGGGAPPAMLRGCTAGFPKKTGWMGFRRGGIGDTTCTDCGIPTTCKLYSFCASKHNHLIYQKSWIVHHCN